MGIVFIIGGTIPRKPGTSARTSPETPETPARTSYSPLPKNVARRCSFLAASPCTHTGSGDRNVPPYKKNLHTRRVCVLFPPPKDACPPGQSSFGRIVFLPRTRAAGVTALCNDPAALTVRHEIEKTRRCFRRCIVPGTTRKHADSSLTALQGISRPSGRSYWHHSYQRRAFQEPVDETGRGLPFPPALRLTQLATAAEGEGLDPSPIDK